MTSQKQISLFTEEQLTFLPEDFPANHIVQQDNEKEKRMNAIYGRKCLEQFERFNQPGLWAKMFSALLIGMEGWYSTRCKLTWKMKATKSHRFYFQLVPSTLPTDGTGYGLLLTPTVVQTDEHPDKMRAIAKKNGYQNGTKYGSLLSQVKYSGLFPTPTAVQRDHPERVEKLIATGATTMMSRKAGENRPNSILDAVMFYGMLPTPNASDNRDRGGPKNKCVQKRIENGKQVGLTMMVDGQLNPQFVMEMMGFPPNWTELPFLNGNKNQSKEEETQ
jgi:hypothetical protein